MNFLNKKYTPNVSQQNGHQQSVNSSQYRHQSNSQILHESHSTKNLSENNIVNANCDIHCSQQVRHMCLQCAALLCAECISEHLQIHRSANTFPTIQTLQKIHEKMHEKIQYISAFISQNIHQVQDINKLKQINERKLSQLHKQLLKVIQKWFKIFQENIRSKFNYTKLIKIRQEMYQMSDEVNMLTNALNMKCTPTVLKKVHQIDSQKLIKGYSSMLQQNQQYIKQLQIQCKTNWNKILESLQVNIQVNKFKQQQQSINYPLQEKQNNFQINQKNKNNKNSTILHNIFYEGNNNYLNLVDTLNHRSSNYLLPFKVYPLNSTLLLHNLLYITGGLQSQHQPSNVYYIYDYKQKIIKFKGTLKNCRSSHSMIHVGNIVYLIGGFNKQGECTNIEILNLNYENQTIPYECKWGGKCQLAHINNYIYKLSIQGFEIIDLKSGKCEINKSKYDGIFHKGMKLQQCNENELILFGDDCKYYIFQVNSQLWKQYNNNVLIQPIIDSISLILHDNKFQILALTSHNRIINYQSSLWSI